MVEPKFCWSCGHAVQLGYSFCEACGAELTTAEQNHAPASNMNQTSLGSNNQDTAGFVTQSNVTTPSNPPVSSTQYPKGSLFDPQREFYVLHEKYWNWGSGDILDENGAVIGKMKRIFLSFRARIELQEADGTLVGQIHRKLAAIRPTYDLKDTQDLLIGRLRKAILNVIHPKIWFEDAFGNHILEARGSFMRYDFVVYDMSGKVVAEINMLNRWKEFFLGGSFLDFSDRYAIRILDKSVDRRFIIGFCLAIDNTMHDNAQVGLFAVGPFRIGAGHGHWHGGIGSRGPWHFRPF